MPARSFTIYTKTLNVKASYATTALAQAAAVMKIIDTSVLGASRNEIQIFLNCDAAPTAVGTLDVDHQVSPDDSSQVFYTVGQFTQVDKDGTTAFQQARVPNAISRYFRCLPTLTSTFNFGCQISFPLVGYTS